MINVSRGTLGLMGGQPHPQKFHLSLSPTLTHFIPLNGRVIQQKTD